MYALQSNGGIKFILDRIIMSL